MKSSCTFLSEEQKLFYSENGFCIIDNALSINDARQTLNMIDFLSHQILVLKHRVNTKGVEGAYLHLLGVDRADAGRVFDAANKIPLVNRLNYGEKFQKIAQALLKTEFVLASPSQMNIRTDHPGEQKHLYPWHTDYSYNFSSKNSLVFWIPLQDVSEFNGSLHIIPKSHTYDLNIEFVKDVNQDKNSSKYFRIDQTEIDKLIRLNGELRPNLRLGQALCFDSKLIHKSGANHSNVTRYALQSRWFDAASYDAVSNLYIGGIDEGNDPSIYLKAV